MQLVSLEVSLHSLFVFPRTTRDCFYDWRLLYGEQRAEHIDQNEVDRAADNILKLKLTVLGVPSKEVSWMLRNIVSFKDYSLLQTKIDAMMHPHSGQPKRAVQN